MDNILYVDNLCKKYKNFKLNNVSLKLPKGFIMGLIGENGAGKTTLIKLIMNLVKKDSGDIKVFDKDNLKFEREIKDRIGFVYDEVCYYDHMSLKENGNMVSMLYSKWDKDKFNYYLNKFELNKDKKLKELSKGMRMKFSLCIALSHGAEFIIMDEPTVGLDPVVRSEVLEELQSLMENENMGVLISTHITSDLEKIADYITFIKDGSIIFSKSKDEIMESYKIIKGDCNILTKEVEKHFEGISKNRFGFEGLTSQVDKVREILGDNIVVDRATIEDIMILKK
ncbi:MULTISPECIES: ATP-binding cassette domain-containing protein [unclassified Clostridium]|uniref:ABC transporter ATP-binding protein n=1 Tax=Clostridium sulfidigenes TaxID=318464 RepID=A0A927WBX2_9CLOT|nr:ABC transporter ATP-binding protein [Clostridium sulfidigenes]